MDVPVPLVLLVSSKVYETKVKMQQKRAAEKLQLLLKYIRVQDETDDRDREELL